jgi:hypothetical protein
MAPKRNIVTAVKGAVTARKEGHDRSRARGCHGPIHVNVHVNVT